MKLIANIFKITSTKQDAYPGDIEGDSIIATGEASASKGETAQVYGMPGFIANPPAGIKGVRFRIGSLDIIIGALNYQVSLPADPGETKVYSTDGDGAETGSMSLKTNGKLGYKNINLSEDLKTLLSDLITEIKAITTTGSPTLHTVSPASQALLTTINTRLGNVMEAL